MKKGINTVINETKVELINLLNSKIEMGVPISVIGLIINDIQVQISNKTSEAITKEKIECEKIEAQEATKEQAEEIEEVEASE